jgi:uncharacterized protein
MSAESPPRLCVFCRTHPVDQAWRPFCSERCKLQDLARWADGLYCVPAEPVTEESENLELKTQKD